MADLRTVVVIDYQNVHLMGHGLFPVSRYLPRHETLIDPLLFAQRLLEARNRAQAAGRPAAALRRVLVYRGQPSAEDDPKPYARNQAQKAHWERDRRVSVTLRPLKYEHERGPDGRALVGPDGRKVVTGKREKGIDVLCALALVREASLPDVDLVILASQDTDLEPALDEALALGHAKIETFCWYHPENRARSKQIRPAKGTTVWNTRLGEEEFKRCWDLTDYT